MDYIMLWMRSCKKMGTYRDRNGACNFSAVRKIVLAAFEKSLTKKKYSKKVNRL
ncbi:MAG: hypothetical protein WDZ28_02060 [Simkaniaceae bacterium]